MKQLTGLDATFLHFETPETPMHVGSVHLYELPPGYRGDFYRDVRQHVSGHVHLVPLFRRKLALMPLELANPVWVEDDEVDLDYHVRRVVLPLPGSITQLEDCVARLHSILMDRSRPLWEFYVIEGLESGQVAFYAKVHHAALDGAAGLALVSALLDATPQPREVEPPPREHRREQPGIVALLGTAIQNTVTQYAEIARHLPEAIQALASRALADWGLYARGLQQDWSLGPITPLNVAITKRRAFATLSLPLAEARQIAHRMDATLNDVVLAVCAGGLRRYLEAHDGVPERPLIAAVPVSLRQPGDKEMNNQATMTLASLATHVADPLERLRAIRDSTRAAKESVGSMRSAIFTDFPSIGVPWLMTGLASLYGLTNLASVLPPVANLVVSNVHGPEAPLYLAGAKMATYWPVSIVVHGIALNITVESYCGSLDFGLTACRRAVPDVRDLARHMADAHAELKARILSEGKAPAAAPKAAGARAVRRKKGTSRARPSAVPR